MNGMEVTNFNMYTATYEEWKAMSRVNFEKVEWKAARVWKENGKRRQKTKTFMQTISPFNLDADGNPKDREQIYRELREKADRWMEQSHEQNDG